MYSWKITKYKPNRHTDEWTSISDVGKVFSGKILTMGEYLRVENTYLQAIRLLAKCNQVSTFVITNVEIYKKLPSELTYKNGQSIDLESSLVLAQHVLREELWCKFMHPKMFVHFGYDYYMYIGSENPASRELKEICKLGLSVEQQVSPQDKGTVLLP